MSDEYVPTTDDVAQRVAAYLDELDRVVARRGHDYMADEVHEFNDHPLRRSDLRALLADRAAHDESVRAGERERIAQAIVRTTGGYYSTPGPPEDRTQYYAGLNHAARIVRGGS